MVSSSDEDNDNESNIVFGKRKRHEETYRRNVNKLARNSGAEYKNYKGKTVHAKQSGPPCNCKRHKCFDGIQELDRIDILQRILNLPSKNEQDLFIQSLIEIHDVKQRRPRKDDSARTVDKMYTYFVMVGNQRTPVCYKAFLSLLSISDKRVKRLRSLAKEGKNPLDKRERHLVLTE
ncbi:uncharacterized protein LOC111054627 [Nilaparvata lugens]|uniref:uncharacterized protein LOC111054627 n=1 Tax=Nilaparvata lugens TaxID=108931 RepID=UPI00193E6BBC|nr:uncharacterized protein LOC111054627 [Nilaparvata lugens]